MIEALLNTPKTGDDWQRWSFDNAQDHLQIIQRIEATSGNVTGITLTNGGSGYTSLPSVILDPNGSGAAFELSIVGGVIQSVSVQSSGVGYRSAEFAFSGGGGTGATAVITLNRWISLPVYQLDPVNFQNPADFIWRHAQTHTDMNGALGLQSIDLSDIDIKDPNKLDAWIYSNYQEHNNAHNRLSI